MATTMRVFGRGMRDGIPISLGYFGVSFALGIAAKSTGLTVWQAVLMSGLCVTSAGEFSALTLIAASGSYAAMAFNQAVINIRYLLMSCALSQKLSPETKPIHRFVLSYALTDEIFAASVARASISKDGFLDPVYGYGLAAVSVPGWMLGTGLGVLLGQALPAMVVNALGVALYGMFIAIIVPPARKNFFLAALIVVSMLMSWLLSVVPLTAGITEGVRVAILTLVIAGAAAVIRPIEEPQEETA